MKSILVSLAFFVILHQFSGCYAETEQDALALLTSTQVGNEVDAENDTRNSTTTTAIPPTTTVPTSTPGNWRFNYTGFNQYCIMMDSKDLELDITYQMMNGNYSTLKFKAPASTEVAPLSTCGFNLTDNELEEKLVLKIPLDNSTVSSVFALLEFFFTRHPNITGDKTLDKSQVYKIVAVYSYSQPVFVDPMFPGQSETVVSNGTLKEFSVLKDRSYQCNSASSIKIDDRLTLRFSGLRTQAFVANNHFDAPEPCPADSQSSDLVPIIIGAVLAAIVLIVLVAYLIGRARLRRQTYESI